MTSRSRAILKALRRRVPGLEGRPHEPERLEPCKRTGDWLARRLHDLGEFIDRRGAGASAQQLPDRADERVGERICESRVLGRERVSCGKIHRTHQWNSRGPLPRASIAFDGILRFWDWSNPHMPYSTRESGRA
jgi:hypothetical protein